MSPFAKILSASILFAASAFAAPATEWVDGTHHWPAVKWSAIRFRHEVAGRHALTEDDKFGLEKIYTVEPFLTTGWKFATIAGAKLEAQIELEALGMKDGTEEGESITVTKPQVLVQFDKSGKKMAGVLLVKEGSITLEYNGPKKALYEKCVIRLDRETLRVDLKAQRFGFEFNDACGGAVVLRNFYELVSVSKL